MTLVMQHRFEPIEKHSGPSTRRSRPRLVIEHLDGDYGPGVALASICTVAEPPAPEPPTPGVPRPEPADSRHFESPGWHTA